LSQRGRYADLDADDAGLSEPQRALAKAVRELCRIIDGSLRGISEELQRRNSSAYASKSVLGQLVNGRQKRPKRLPLKALYLLAKDRSEATGTPIISWSELEKMREAVASPAPISAVSCRKCGTLAPLEQLFAPSTSEPHADRPIDADDRRWHGTARRRGPLSSAALRAWRRRISRGAAPGMLPVPPAQGDRQHRAVVDAAWPDVQDLAFYLAAENYEGATGILRHAGSAALPAEAADAVVTCRDRGLHEAAETILSYAGKRDEGDVLRIVRSLNARHRYSDADELLNLALGE
jgi:hypothetical protein